VDLSFKGSKKKEEGMKERKKERKTNKENKKKEGKFILVRLVAQFRDSSVVASHTTI